MKTILIDIMLNSRFVCQMKYIKRGFPVMIDGDVKEAHDIDDIKRYVEEKRPSLKGKPYIINFTSQRV